MIRMQFFNDITPSLKGLIRHYWYVNGEEENIYHQKLLPMDHVDLIMTMGDLFTYGKNEKIIQPNRIHFHGIREKSLEIIQPKKTQAFGISFTPWGFYFFTKHKMSEYINKVVNLKDINYELWEELSHHMIQFSETSNFVKSIEETLLKYINIKEQEQINCSIIKDFIHSDSNYIKEYCESNQLSIKKLERIFIKYIGISPKRFLNIVRFEESTRDIMYDRNINLTDISYKHGYYDQSHFTKAFKYYTNYSPKDFQSEKPALKSNMDYE